MAQQLDFILHPEIESYLARTVQHKNPVFQEMEVRAGRENFPIVGPLVGSLLALFAKTIGAKTVFEMGSGYGYSGLWFASVLPEGGKVFMTDGSKRYAEEAKSYFKKAGQEKKCEFRIGDAVELIDEVPGLFDIIFIDMDKARYPIGFREALPKLRKGGCLLADNVLWFGHVLDRNPDEDTRGILEFTRLIYETPQLHSTIIPLRDGVSVSLKLA
ncbi:MAG: O-methyltransferase [Candidatus Omnitrophica bacterium]|nr:O-methyltransferase [Candidatus Omnitrophota bacterium]